MKPEDIERDKATMAAVTARPWYREDVFVLGADNLPALDGRGHHQGILHAAATVHAVNRLPEYIAEVERLMKFNAEIAFAIDANVRHAADKVRMQERTTTIETAADKAEHAARRHAEMSETAGAEREAARASALRWALKTLRGAP